MPDGRLLHKSTIKKLIVHFKEVGHCLPMFTVKLKQTKLTSEVADIILAKIGDDKKAATAPQLQKAVIYSTGIHLACSTIRRIRKELGWVVCVPRTVPLITEQNKAHRLRFAKDVIASREILDGILFTDECTVWLQNNSVICFREIYKDGSKGPRPQVPQPKHSFKVCLVGNLTMSKSCCYCILRLYNCYLKHVCIFF